MKIILGSLYISMLLALPVNAQAIPTQQHPVPERKATIELIAQTIQVVSVAVGVVISVLSFTSAQVKNAEAKRSEAAKPFLELRQRLYMEAVHTAAILSNPKDYNKEEISEARKRFRQLYVAELSLIEASSVEQKMVELAKIVDPELEPFTPARAAAYDLSHALRDSLIKSWNLKESIVDNPKQF